MGERPPGRDDARRIHPRRLRHIRICEAWAHGCARGPGLTAASPWRFRTSTQLRLAVGTNGGETAIDGPTFLSTIGWDWLPAIRDRDTGIWLPVTMDSTGPVIVKDPFVTADLGESYKTADLHVSTTLENKSAQPVTGTLDGNHPVAERERAADHLQQICDDCSKRQQDIALDSKSTPELHLSDPKLWWPNGYGPQNLYTLTLRFDVGKTTSASETRQFGIRKIEYHVPDSENLTLSVNGVRVMARGGNWGLGRRHEAHSS